MSTSAESGDLSGIDTRTLRQLGADPAMIKEFVDAVHGPDASQEVVGFALQRIATSIGKSAAEVFRAISDGRPKEN